ncbi:MAG: right-handed parallel beta-helix repeat-containing protein [Candidatus Hydrogenedentes bacterium]|nr:right-handed parallel beta-helix repeat-containing protein [Candidatus Hydrogenedentota bacterium]
MWYSKRFNRAVALLLAVPGAVLIVDPARAATLDVCATCTHTTLDSAFTAATSGDTIVLDGPTLLTDPPATYTLATDLVINAAKNNITIRGKQASRPDKIEIVGTGGGPVITVEDDRSFEILGVTIKGGTTGILAMPDSTVEIRRCMFDGITGISLNCLDPTNVYIAGSVITGSGGDAIRIDQGGKLNVLQCTLLTNTGLGVNALDGEAHIVATLIHDSGAGIDGTPATLEVLGNWVTDAGGNPVAMPTGVTDANAVIDVLVPATVFETVIEPFPGKLASAAQERQSGVDTGELETDPFSMPFTGLDFDTETRATGNLVVGADDADGSGGSSDWTECFVIQGGFARAYVGEGVITIEINARRLDLSDAELYIKHEDVVDIRTAANIIGPLPIITESLVDTSFGTADYTIDEDVLETLYPAPGFNIQKDYIIYLNTDDTQSIAATNDLHGDTEGNFSAVGQAVYGRVFGLDTIPPVVTTNLTLLADQYATAATLLDDPIDGGAPWSGAASALLGNAGANAGYLNGNTGEPSVFLDGNLPVIPPYLKANVGLALTFTDVGAGFAVNGLPNGRVENTPGGKQAALFRDYTVRPGFAWWDSADESTPELIANASELTVTYTNSGGNTLQTVWNFTNLAHDGVNQWHAIANIRVMDLAGNEATLDPSFQNFIPMRPYHFWWFPDARGELRSGPHEVPSTNPVFSWGLFRGQGGEDPQDPFPCVPSVRWRLWGADFPGVAATSWTDLTAGTWSNWMDANTRVIGLDTIFTGTTRLRDLMTGPVGSEYLIAVQGYDEAGNLQSIPVLGNLTTSNDLTALNVNFRRWTDPGVSMAAALDTKVQANFWYNNPTLAALRAVDAGEKSFGAASRVALPLCPARVEAGFNITMEIPDSVSPASARVSYELFEDGAVAAVGLIDPSSAPGGYTFVVPQDLITAPGPSAIITGGGLDFLNVSTCYPGAPDRLGDDGPLGAEPPYRQRDVKYQVLFRTGILQNATLPPNDPASYIFDTTPATVEFTVTVDRALKDEQPNKSFSKE